MIWSKLIFQDICIKNTVINYASLKREIVQWKLWISDESGVSK